MHLRGEGKLDRRWPCLPVHWKLRSSRHPHCRRYRNSPCRSRRRWLFAELCWRLILVLTSFCQFRGSSHPGYSRRLDRVVCSGAWMSRGARGSSENCTDDGFNCEALTEDFQVYWQINGDNLNVELVALGLDDGEYLAFGVSDRSRQVDSKEQTLV